MKIKSFFIHLKSWDFFFLDAFVTTENTSDIMREGWNSQGSWDLSWKLKDEPGKTKKKQIEICKCVTRLWDERVERVLMILQSFFFLSLSLFTLYAHVRFLFLFTNI